MGAVLSHPSHFSPGGVTWSSSLKKSLEGHVPALLASCRALCSPQWTAPDLWHTALPVLTPRAAHFCARPAAWPPRHIRLHGDLHSPGLTAALAGQSSAWSTHEGVSVACVQSHGRPGRTGASSAAQAPDLTRLSCSPVLGMPGGRALGGAASGCTHRATGGPGGLQKPGPLPWQTTSSCFLANLPRFTGPRGHAVSACRLPGQWGGQGFPVLAADH